MIAAEIESFTSYFNAPVLSGLVEDKLVDAHKVGYNGVKEEVRTPFFM